MRFFLLILFSAVVSLAKASDDRSLACGITGPGQVCVGQSARFSFGGDPCNITYTIYVWNNNSNNQGRSFTTSFSSPGSYTISLYAECPDDGTCSPPRSASYTKTVSVVAVSATPAIVASQDRFCENGNVTLSVASPESVTYTWSSGLTTLGTGNSITLPVSETTAFTVSTGSGDCKVSSSKTIMVYKTEFTPIVSANSYHKAVLNATGAGVRSTHYWQQTSSGTNTEHSLDDDFAVFENESYSIRQYSSHAACWTVASEALHVMVVVTPPLAQINQIAKLGYSQIYLSNEDKAHVLSYADYYWVSTPTGEETAKKFWDGYSLLEKKVHYLRGRDRRTGTWGDALTVTAHFGNDESLNWIHLKTFDGTLSTLNGQSVENKAGEQKTYFDDSGRSIQTQTKKMQAGSVLASQVLFDRFDRPVGSTLAAPILSTNFRYAGSLLTGPGGSVYSYKNFDWIDPAQPANSGFEMPDPVSNNLEGTVGWYYSENNKTESLTPVTQYPYSRTAFYTDGSGEVRQGAAPGNQHRMGKGHDVWSGTFPVFNELNDYLDKRRIAGFPDQLGSSGKLAGEAIQNVNRDENGRFTVSISDRVGNVLLTARSGESVGNMLEVTNAESRTGDPLSSQLIYFYLIDRSAVTISGNGDYVVEDIVHDTRTNNRGSFEGSDQKWPAGFYRLVMAAAPLDKTVSISYVNSLKDVSYNFYDDAGRVVASVSPGGYKSWVSGTPYASIEKTTHVYNFKGKLMEVSEPDAGTTMYIYRKDGKIRFSENAQQRGNPAGKGKFSYTHYDDDGRPVESGEYTGATIGFKSAAMKALIESPANATEWTEQIEKVDWVKTTYDIPDGPIPYIPADTYKQQFVRGAVSSSQNINSKTWYSYDELGRVTWMAQKPTRPDGTGLNRTFLTEYTYDFLGNVLTVANSSYDNAGNKLDAFYHHYEYDADKRLYKSHTSLDGTNPKLRATYSYYLHGPLKRIVLGDSIQGIDFVYNINGWLTQINHPDKSKDPGGDGNDVFGMVLDYYESDMGGIFPAAISAPQAVDPGRFHKLPNTFDKPKPSVAYEPKPAYKQQMLDALAGMKSLQKNYSAPVTLDYFKDSVANSIDMPSVTEVEPVVFETASVSESTMASAKGGLYESPAAVDVVPDAVEFAALKAIYDNMNGVSWMKKTNWPTTWPASATSAQFGTWYGVTVTNGDISTINLSGNNLTGALVPEIGTLTQLQVLQLQTNAITSIPAAIGQLTKLTHLYLLTNQLTGIPPEITGMTALKYLRLQANQIDGAIPSFLGSFPALLELNLARNNFTGGIPASLNTLTNLTLLDVSLNDLTGPIADLGGLQKLTTLDAQSNQLQGSIPAHLGNLAALGALYLADNDFSGAIPPELNNLANAVTIDLTTNALTGEIPDLSNLKKLRALYLGSNQLQAIPATLGELSELRYLYLQNNALTGSIPPELGKLANLLRLYLNTNQLTGELPPALGELAALQNLDFSNNQLLGPLPASWGNMAELQSLNLGTNKLTGTLPGDWKRMAKVTTFYVGSNLLEGSIPPAYAALTQLRDLRVSDNKLTGEIPASVFNGWAKLTTLYLNDNNFSGAFPAAIGSCPLFAYLSASHNNFTSLPQELLSRPALYYINIQYNRIESIPNFSNHPNKANLTLYLQNNRIDFANLEPVFIPGPHGIKTLGYSPQALFTDPARVSVPAGAALIITARPKGGYGSVVWEKKTGATWVNVNAGNEDASRQTFKITNPQPPHEGIYRWTETSTQVPSLTLQSGEIAVKLGDALPDPQATEAPLYNGLIRSVYWRTDKAFGADEEEYSGVYRFEYDDKYQLKESRWGDPNKVTWTSFADAGNKYRVTGLDYDPNGNIQHLRRYADDGFIKNNFVYHYDAGVSKNRLTSVDNYTNSYGYDAIGRMTLERKTEGADHYVEYDVTGKVRKVFFDERKSMPNVEYRYDDRGFRLAKIDYQAKVTTWYIRDASGNIISVYEQKGNLPDPLRPVTWTTFTNATYSNGVLALPAGYTTGNALAADTVKAGQDGYLEYVISDVNKAKLFGFSKVPGGTKFEFFIAASTATFSIRKAGAGQSFAASNAYAIGDSLRISREGNKMRFYHNGANILELDIAATDEFVAWASLAGATSTIKGSDLAFKRTGPAAEQTTLTLKEIPVYGAGKLGTYYPQEDGSMAYEITDHLGNVRALLRDHVSTYTATVEDDGTTATTNTREAEKVWFSNVEETAVNDARMNYTADDATTDPTPSRSAYLFWQDGMAGMEAVDRSVGPAIGLKVNAGDKVDIETWVRYEEKTAYTNNAGLAVLSQALGSALAYQAGFEAMTMTQTTSALSAALAAEGFTSGDPDDTRPYAYLNYLLFDENNVLIDAGFQRVTADAGFEPGYEGIANNRSHARLAFDEPVTINQAGSIYIWVSNESEDTKVWFDDLKAVRSTSLVVQATDYGVWGEVLREQKSEDRKYKFGYQGQFAERDEETGWSHFELREYDPVIGRWTAVDPMKQFHSPYIGMGNNPLAAIDPDGGSILTTFVNTETGERVEVQDGSNDVVTVESENWADFIESYNKWSGFQNADFVTSFLSNRYGSMHYEIDEMLIIRGFRNNPEGNEYGLKIFVEGKNAFPNPDRAADNKGSILSVSIYTTFDEREKANLHFHYYFLALERPSEGADMDSDHIGDNIYNVEISKNYIWLYNRYRKEQNPVNGKLEDKPWGVQQIAIPYKQ